MLTKAQALCAMLDGFIIEAIAADGECEGIIDPLHIDQSQADVELQWHLDQGHTLVKAGLSDLWANIPF